MSHIIRFAPEGSLIEFSPEGLGHSGRRGVKSNVHILASIQKLNKVSISVINTRSRLAGAECSYNPKNTYLFDMAEFNKYHGRFNAWVTRSEVGKINSFSRRSRSRLNKRIATIKRDRLPLFVTLTYHEQIPDSFEGYKAQLHHFFVSFLRAFPKAGIMWKLEYQWRGYAHFHLLIWNVDFEKCLEFVPKKWNDIAGYGSELHLKFHQGLLSHGNKPCVEKIKSWNGVMYYCSKYFAKNEVLAEGLKFTGRVWGCVGSHLVATDKKRRGLDGKEVIIYKRVSNIPFSMILEFTCSLEVALEFRKEVIRVNKFEFERLGFWCGNYHPDYLIFLDSLLNNEWLLNNPPDTPPDFDLYDINGDYIG
jgi:hypothetical protein